jgi:hypothetical protein
MRVDRKWVERNLGYDPITRPPPDTTFAFAQAAKKTATTEDLRREIIDFDSESPAVHGLQHGDRPVAIHRCSMAQGTGAQDGSRCRVRMCSW